MGMASILEGELAELVTEALEAERVPVAITVTRTIPGEPNPDTPWIPAEPTITPYPCRGWVEAYDDDAINQTLIDARDVKVMVLTTSIAIIPTDATDTITLNARDYAIVNVKHDASGALYIIQARA